MSKGCNKCFPYDLIEPGAEMEVIGGVPWNVLHFSYKPETLGGALNGMGTKVLASINAFTEVENS